MSWKNMDTEINRFGTNVMMANIATAGVSRKGNIKSISEVLFLIFRIVSGDEFFVMLLSIVFIIFFACRYNICEFRSFINIISEIQENF